MKIIEIVKEPNQISIKDYDKKYHGGCIIAKTNNKLFILKEENNKYIWQSIEILFCAESIIMMGYFCSIKDAINDIIEKGFKVYAIASYNLESFITINI